MFRIMVFSAVAVISVGVSAANAETRSRASAKSPGQITAASSLLAEKQESCRLDAKRQKLAFFKRRSFVRKCIEGKT